MPAAPVTIQAVDSVLADPDACADAVLQAFHHTDLWLAGDITPSEPKLEDQLEVRNQLWGRYVDARGRALLRLAEVLPDQPCEIHRIGWFETKDVQLVNVSRMRGTEPTVPIVVCDPECDRGLVLLDGRHRVLAARMDERETLSAVFLSPEHVVLWPHFWNL